MLHTQYVFVYEDTCILVINFAPPKVKSWLRHCLQTLVSPSNNYELCFDFLYSFCWIIVYFLFIWSKE